MPERGPILIGIDIGSTNLKAVATDARRKVLCVLRRPMMVVSPAPGATEFDLDALETSLYGVLSDTCARLAADGHNVSEIAAISIASIGESFVGTDSAGNRATTCPTWYDRRTARFRAQLGLSAKEWYETTGMVDDDIYTIWRLAWLKREAPDAFGRVRHWFSVADYAVYMLSAARVANPSLAARTGLADRNTAQWSPSQLDLIGLTPSQLPMLEAQGTVAGHLTAAAANVTGLLAGTPVVNAGHDHPCAGLGCGLVNPGTVIDSAGTSEALKTVVAHPISWQGVNGGEYDCYPHVVPGLFLLSGHIPSSGAAIDWMLSRFGSAHEMDALLAEAEEASPGAGGVRVAPYLQGTGSPWNLRDERLKIAGVNARTKPGDMIRATYEGLAAWLAINLERFEKISGHSPDELVLTGGGARNRAYTAIKAAFLQKTFAVPAIAETAGVGAATVGGLAVGLYADADDAIAGDSYEMETFRPDDAVVRAYELLRQDLIDFITPVPNQ